MKRPLTFRLKLAVLAGALRLLGRIIGASRKRAPTRPGGNGRVIDGESRRVDERGHTH